MAQLSALITGNDWFMRVLRCVRAERVPDAWTGAGALRDLVWGKLYGPGFSPADVRDVDVAFFDPNDLSRAYDDLVTGRLGARCPGCPGRRATKRQFIRGMPEIRGRSARAAYLDRGCDRDLARDRYSRRRSAGCWRRDRDLRPAWRGGPDWWGVAPEPAPGEPGRVARTTGAPPTRATMAGRDGRRPWLNGASRPAARMGRSGRTSGEADMQP